MRLPSQAAPVKRGDILEPAIDRKDRVIVGADPNDPAPFRATCQWRDLPHLAMVCASSASVTCR
jgi:hypothetical protein